MEHVYKGARSLVKSQKREFLHGLYNLESKDFLSNKAYARESSLLEKYWDGESITIIPLGDKLSRDKFHAINFLIQSTSSDIFFTSSNRSKRGILKNTKTHITAALIHDSVC